MRRQIDLEIDQKNQSLRKVELLQAQLKLQEARRPPEKSFALKTKLDEMQMLKITNNLIKEN